MRPASLHIHNQLPGMSCSAYILPAHKQLKRLCLAWAGCLFSVFIPSFLFLSAHTHFLRSLCHFSFVQSFLGSPSSCWHLLEALCSRQFFILSLCMSFSFLRRLPNCRANSPRSHTSNNNWKKKKNKQTTNSNKTTKRHRSPNHAQTETHQRKAQIRSVDHNINKEAIFLEKETKQSSTLVGVFERMDLVGTTEPCCWACFTPVG